MKNKKIFYILIFLFILLGAWFFPPTEKIWKKIDIQVFYYLNGWIKHRQIAQYFWAFANHNIMDWIHDLVFLGFFTYYIMTPSKESIKRKVSQCIVSILMIASTIFFVNKVLFSKIFSIQRASPSLVCINPCLLSEKIMTMHVKDQSMTSFPGDHGTTACLFILLSFLIMNKKCGYFATIYGIFICLPRLITGAHWLSDNILGSFFIATVVVNLLFNTNVFSTVVVLIEKCLGSKKTVPLCKNKENKQASNHL